jgi:hypothetical protein
VGSVVPEVERGVDVLVDVAGAVAVGVVAQQGIEEEEAQESSGEVKLRRESRRGPPALAT